MLEGIGDDDSDDASSQVHQMRDMVEREREHTGETPTRLTAWRLATDEDLARRHARQVQDPSNIAGAFDFDGVVAPVVSRAEDAMPDCDAAAAIREMADLTRGQVYISARGPEDLRQRVGDVECRGNYGLAVLRREAVTPEIPAHASAGADRLRSFTQQVAQRGLPTGVVARSNGDLAWGINLRAATGSDLDGARGWAAGVQREASEQGLHSTGENALSIDITVPTTADKGTALLNWLSDLGVDSTDEPLDLVTVAGDTESDLPMLRAALEATSDGRVRHSERIAVRHTNEDAPPPSGLLSLCSLIAEGPTALARVLSFQAGAARMACAAAVA